MVRCCGIVFREIGLVCSGALDLSTELIRGMCVAYGFIS